MKCFVGRIENFFNIFSAFKLLKCGFKTREDDFAEQQINATR